MTRRSSPSYAGFYQNYAVTVDGDVETWGLKGYVCGTDDLGRDVFNRIINGGKVTMTVGAISVIIQLIIGIILGGLAGYFGGWVDNIIMRISEIVGGLPFLPFAMILSAIIGTRITRRAAYVPHHGRAWRSVLAGHLPSDPRADPLAA